MSRRKVGALLVKYTIGSIANLLNLKSLGLELPRALERVYKLGGKVVLQIPGY